MPATAGGAGRRCGVGGPRPHLRGPGGAAPRGLLGRGHGRAPRLGLPAHARRGIPPAPRRGRQRRGARGGDVSRRGPPRAHLLDRRLLAGGGSRARRRDVAHRRHPRPALQRAQGRRRAPARRPRGPATAPTRRRPGPSHAHGAPRGRWCAGPLHVPQPRAGDRPQGPAGAAAGPPVPRPADPQPRCRRRHRGRGRAPGHRRLQRRQHARARATRTSRQPSAPAPSTSPGPWCGRPRRAPGTCGSSRSTPGGWTWRGRCRWSTRAGRVAELDWSPRHDARSVLAEAVEGIIREKGTDTPALRPRRWSEQVVRLATRGPVSRRRRS